MGSGVSKILFERALRDLRVSVGVFQSGQSSLSIAQQLGYISVVEVLRQVTTVIVTTTTDQHKLHAPEMMHEPAMSDDDEDEDDGRFDLTSLPVAGVGDIWGSIGPGCQRKKFCVVLLFFPSISAVYMRLFKLTNTRHVACWTKPHPH